MRSAAVRAFFVAVVLALAATTVAAQAQDRAAIQVDARAEVAAALYSASATQAAAERAADAQLRAQATEIERLRLEGRTTRAQIAELEEHYVSNLAQRDRAYAQEISVFRGALQDIASTPEGATALARFNTGDELGALSILDDLRVARDHARRRRADIESAAEGRRIAALALEARNRGRLDTAAVILRFEEVVRLDSSEFWDHIELARLYSSAGRLEEARNTGARALSLATNERSRMVASIDYADTLSATGDMRSAKPLYDDALARARLLAANGDDIFSPDDLSVALSRLGDAHMAFGEFGAAVTYYNEALTTDQDWHRRTRYLAAAQNMCVDLLNLTDAIVALGDLASADQYAAAAVRACSWVVEQSSDGEDALQLAYARWRLACVKAVNGDTHFARAEVIELRSFASALLEVDPSNELVAVQASMLEITLADLDLLEGRASAGRERLINLIATLNRRRNAGGHVSLIDAYE